MHDEYRALRLASDEKAAVLAIRAAEYLARRARDYQEPSAPGPEQIASEIADLVLRLGDAGMSDPLRIAADIPEQLCRQSNERECALVMLKGIHTTLRAIHNALDERASELDPGPPHTLLDGIATAALRIADRVHKWYAEALDEEE